MTNLTGILQSTPDWEVFLEDANYHYVCTADNHWRRVALGDF